MQGIFYSCSAMHQVAGYKVIEQTSISESQWFDNFYPDYCSQA